MRTAQRKYGDSITLLSSPVRILHDGRRTTTASGATKVDRNPSIALHLVDAAVQEVDKPASVADRENSFDDPTDSSLLDERPALRIHPTQSHSSARLKYTVRLQLFIILDVVEGNVV